MWLKNVFLRWKTKCLGFCYFRWFCVVSESKRQEQIENGTLYQIGSSRASQTDHCYFVLARRNRTLIVEVQVKAKHLECFRICNLHASLFVAKPRDEFSSNELWVHKVFRIRHYQICGTICYLNHNVKTIIRWIFFPTHSQTLLHIPFAGECKLLFNSFVCHLSVF